MRTIVRILILALMVLWPVASVFLAGQHLPGYENIEPWPTMGRVFQIWGWGTTVLLFLWMWCDLWKPQFKQWDVTENTIAVIFPFFVGVFLLNLICQTPFFADDFTYFRVTSEAMMAGGNPYTVAQFPQCFPPPILYIYSGLYEFAHYLLSFAQFEYRTPGAEWAIVFFFTMVLQWASFLCLTLLAVEFCKRLGLGKLESMGLSLLVLFASCPTWSTYHFLQPLPFVVSTILAAILLMDRYPGLAGFVAALGALIKVYPVMFFWPWLMLRRWWAIVVFVVIVGLVLMLDYMGHRIWFWQEWLNFLFNDPQLTSGVTAFRNNNIPAVVQNTMMMMHAPVVWILAVKWTIRAGIVGWFAWRAWRRYRLGQDFMGHVIDALAFPLFMSPDVWEHGYMFAIPVWLYWTVFHVRRGRSMVAPMVMFLLMFGLPVMSWFPVSYSRLVGMLVGMWISHPNKGFKLCG